MENYIAYQSRHLTPEEFELWASSNVKVRSYLGLDSLAGGKGIMQRIRDNAASGTHVAANAWKNECNQAIRALNEWQKNIGKKVILPALQKASDQLAAMEKSAAAGSKDTGILQQSIGSTKAKWYPATFCGYVASGPRRGYARAVQVVANKKGKQRLKRLSKKFTQSTPTTLTIKNPVAYAEFLRKGRHAIFRPASAKAFPMLAGGKFLFRRRIKEAAPRDFMRSAETPSAAR